MDFNSIIGIIIALAAVFGGYALEGGHPGSLVQFTALSIVLGGTLGAVMGLIQVMENLSDPAHLGTGIAVAFVATIYGVGLANLAFLPIANKLKALIARQVLMREMLVDGLVGIARGENPRLIADRLKGYAV